MTGKAHGNLRSDVPARRSGGPAHQAQPEARKAHAGRVLRSMPIAGLSGAAARTQVIPLQRAVGNRAVQTVITPSAVSVQRKPSASGVKQALGLGKKKKKKKSPAQKAEKLADKASTAKVATTADLEKQIAKLESATKKLAAGHKAGNNENQNAALVVKSAGQRILDNLEDPDKKSAAFAAQRKRLRWVVGENQLIYDEARVEATRGQAGDIYVKSGRAAAPVGQAGKGAFTRLAILPGAQFTIVVLPLALGDMPTGTLHFRLLGPLEVLYDDRPVEVGRPKQRAVLATLLIHANEVVSVDRFADVLWRDEGTARSTGSLPVYIANLRRLVEPERPARTSPERILTRAPGYLIRIAAGEYDAADFERLAAEGRRHLAEGRPRAARRSLGEALCLWRGRALEEFAFADLEAGRLEGLRLAATEDRLVADLALGAQGAVVAELEHLVREQPLSERLVELLMLALYRSGRQVEALRAYTNARNHLRQELGIEPGPHLRRMEGDILAQSPALDWHPPPPEGVAPQVVAPPPDPAAEHQVVFVGRATELAILDRALDRRDSASGAVVVVAGEPGIGKTRLVQEAVARAAARGCVVAWGRCEDGDGTPPFWPWIQAIRALIVHPEADAVRDALAPDAPEISQLVPEVKDLTGELPSPAMLDPESARHRFFDAIAGFLTRLSQHRPVAVILDDLHWGDPPSLRLTAHLAGRLAGSNICLVVTYRDVDPVPDAGLMEILASLARRPGRLDLSLQGLTREEVARFVAHEAGAEAAAGILAAVWDRAGGNPFFVGELTRLLVAEKSLAPGSGTAAVPWAVRQVVGRRMGRLPKGTQRLLAVAAVAGNDFDLRVAARAAGLDLGRALDLVDVAVAAGLVIEQPDAVERFRFSHALVQETIYGGLARLRRARLHGLIADALEEVDGDQAPAAEVAHHLYEAVAVVGPARAVAAASRASVAAQEALAHDVAEYHLRRGLALVATMAAGSERDGHELDLQVPLATLLSLVKGIATPESAQAWERATELCRAVEDQRRLLVSLWGLLTFAWAIGDMDGARTLGEHMLQLERTSCDPAVTVTARLSLGLLAVCCGDLVEGSGHLVAAKEVADAVAEDVLTDVTFADLRVQVDSWLGLTRHLQGAHEEGQSLVDAALARARALGRPSSIVTGLSFALCARVLNADVAEGRRMAEELIDQTDKLPLPDFTYHGRVVRAWALAHGGSQESEVLPLLGALPSALTAGIRPWHPFWLLLTAETWQRLGHFEEALRLVDQAQAEIDAMGSSFSVAEVLRLRGELLASMEPGRRPEALDHLQRAARKAEAQGAMVLRDRALASAARLERAGASPPTPAR